MLALAAELEAYDLEQAIYKTLEANRLKDTRIRLTVSAGLGERGLAPPNLGPITVIVSAQKLDLPPPQILLVRTQNSQVPRFRSVMVNSFPTP